MARSQKKGNTKASKVQQNTITSSNGSSSKKHNKKYNVQDKLLKKSLAHDVFEAEEEDDHRKANDLDDVENLEYEAGEIAEEDDSEIDSDEAFDESDEERFGEYNFLNKSEDDMSASDFEDEEGEDYVDLAEMISNLDSKKRRRPNEDESGNKKRQLKERNEAYNESEYNLGTRQTDDDSKKLSLADLMETVEDESSLSALKTSLETLAGKGKNVTRKAVDAPVAKRVQERMDRQAALATANEEVSKWQPTVNMLREAEHLQFPLQDNTAKPTRSSAAMADKFKAETQLEQQINEALAEAGMKDKELEEFEALKLNKLSIEEVEARRKELRMMRELMFRHEIKAKRLKKIKSKSYRKLKRKEKDRVVHQMDEIDHDMEGDEDVALQRAKERMTLKHKNTSKWAKRALARGVKDEGTREAIMEQLRRGDELRRRMEGENSGDESDGEDEYNGENASDSDDEKVEENEDDHYTVVANNPGRMAFGAKAKQIKNESAGTKNRDSFEEEWLPVNSDDEETEDKVEEHYTVVANNPGRIAFDGKAKQTKAESNADDSANPWLQADTSRLNKKASKNKTLSGQNESRVEHSIAKLNKKKEASAAARDATEDVELDLTNVATISSSRTISTAKTAKGDSDDESLDEDDTPTDKNTVAFSQRELVARAFANDDVVTEFEEEKRAEIEEDEDKVEDLTLPGWGSWGGAGVRENKKKKKIIKVTKGIDADKRKDAKLAHVIINEKLNKKAEKYSSTNVPFPFKTMEQYERSISQPVGSEWNTRQTFMKLTKPRVITKLGKVIDPVKAPFS
ncbi:small-subunit processome [Mycotypha africana]|uniref:small-subunit processome n=1 Tax=Mycotypha africana TaxID=64632 RepID=UPI00230108D1|nr:small-subunit processome [Mycotypha africana]KAI8988151.1 small-subunit processome [Mycotypha africana]